MKHLRSLGWCSHGVRQVCKKEGINYSQFLQEGMELEELTQKIDPQFAKMLRDKYE